MSEKVTKLTPRQKKAIEGLIEGKSVSAVADTVHVARKTIYVWLAQPEFRDELNRLSNLILEEVSSKMIVLASDAADTLSKVLHAKDVPIGNQIQAANAILKRSTELWELYNLSKRVEVIENALAGDEKE